MQQFSVFQTTHVAHGTPPLRGGGVNSAWLEGVEVFRRGVLSPHLCEGKPWPKGQTRKIYSDVLPIPPLNFTGVKEYEIWPQFSRQLPPTQQSKILTLLP